MDQEKTYGKNHPNVIIKKIKLNKIKRHNLPPKEIGAVLNSWIFIRIYIKNINIMKTPKTIIKYPINIKSKNNDRITKLGMLITR